MHGEHIRNRVPTPRLEAGTTPPPNGTENPGRAALWFAFQVVSHTSTALCVLPKLSIMLSPAFIVIVAGLKVVPELVIVWVVAKLTIDRANNKNENSSVFIFFYFETFVFTLSKQTGKTIIC
jgi:hypothetical protein